MDNICPGLINIVPARDSNVPCNGFKKMIRQWGAVFQRAYSGWSCEERISTLIDERLDSFSVKKIEELFSAEGDC